MSKMFEPTTIGGLRIKNRYVMAPMGFVQDVDGGISTAQIAYLAERAKGGFGIIYPSAHTVTDKYELPMYSGNFLHNYDQALRLKAAVTEVHKYGAKFAIQFSPGYGRVNIGPPFETSHVSASDNTAYFLPSRKCRALTIEEIQKIVQSMGVAARFAKAAGCDIIEMHAYGGYLFDQFISPMWNRREDQYGGSLENRLRFLMESYQEVRRVCGSDFPISVKFTPEHGIPGGRTLEGEGLEIVRIFDSMDFAFIHVDDGCYESHNRAIPCVYDPPGSQIHIAEKLRAAGIKSPFLIQGKLNDPETALRLVENGTAELIALGKQAIADPFYPTKVKSGQFEDINYCTACCECLNSDPLDYHDMGCAINPFSAHEHEYFFSEPNVKRKILIVGGGPGGMNTAKLAAQQGHTVELWEKGGKLGGNVNAAGGPDFKFDVKRYNENLQKQVYKAGVTVRLLKEATRESVDKFAPELVIVAAGSKPITPPIPGVEAPNVYDACDILTKTRECAGDKVVVIGGGEVGCEAALYLSRLGKKVTVVEMLDKILSAPMANNARVGLNYYLNKAGIEFKVKTKVASIAENKVVLETADGQSDFECDSIVLAVGFKSDSFLADSLEGGNYKVFTIGDYNKPRKVWYAVHEGFHIIRQLDDLMTGC